MTLPNPIPPIDPKPLNVRSWRLSGLIGPAISCAVLVAVLYQLRLLDWWAIWAMVPTSPLFWTIFVASYLASPLADWVIFRRLWRIPAAGFVALVRKQIGNSILLGYIGEVYFYDWARKRADLTAAPFGAVKDVAILSALMGNAVTLVMLGVAWPFVDVLNLGLESQMLVLSIATVILTSLVAMLFRRRLFSLPRNELTMVAIVHLIRIVVTTGLVALMWHVALPGVALSWWLLLATIGMLLSRLPFLPNKDLVFAGIAVFLIGQDQEIAALVTMIASLVLATHVLLGGILMASALFEREARS